MMASSANRAFRSQQTAAGSAWGWTMAYGALFVVAGLLALLAPGFTTVALAVLLGWVLLITGIAGIVMGFRSHNARRRNVDFLYGAASLIVALFILFDPVVGAASLTLAFAAWLAFRGVAELAAVRATGPGPSRGTLILIGVVDLVLAFLLAVNFPFPAVSVLGVFVGASLLLAGAVTMLAADQLRRLAA
jgi:uncharacterized membrane protein HdeD (DUF308 family)